jgi:flagellar hook-length control protein FliK
MAASSPVSASGSGKVSAGKDLAVTMTGAATSSPLGAGSSAGAGSADGFTAALAALSTLAAPVQAPAAEAPLPPGTDTSAAAGGEAATAGGTALSSALIELARSALSSGSVTGATQGTLPPAAASVLPASTTLAAGLSAAAKASSPTTGPRSGASKNSARAHFHESKTPSVQAAPALSTAAASPAAPALGAPVLGAPVLGAPVPGSLSGSPALISTAGSPAGGEDEQTDDEGPPGSARIATTPVTSAASGSTPLLMNALASGADASTAGASAAGAAIGVVASGLAHPLDASRAATAVMPDGGGTAAGASALSPAAPGATTAAPGAGASAPAAALEKFIATPVTSHEWGRAVAAEVHMLAANGVKEATLRLSPEHLGPVEVHIDLQDTKVNVSFTATHSETRTALEQSVPQLREMFAGAGLSLGQANVQQETRSGSHNFIPRPDQMPADDVEAQPVMTALGLVDEYA